MLLSLNWIIESSPNTKWQKLKQSKPLFNFAVFYLLYAIGVLYSHNFKHGVFELEKKLSLIVLPIILSSTTPIDKKQIRTILKTFVYSCLLATIICVGYAIMMNYREGYTLTFVYNALVNNIHPPETYNYFNYWYFTYKLFAKPIDLHPVYFSLFIVVSCVTAIWLWWDTSWTKKRKNMLLILLLFYFFIIILLLGSRTQLFLMSIFGIIFFIYQSYQHKKLIFGISLLLIVASMGFIVILKNPILKERIIQSNLPGTHFSENKFGEGGLSLRMYKWKYTLEAIKNKPFFGTGTGSSQDELQEIYRKNNFVIGYQNRFNAHNQYLQSFLELGIIGLLALLSYLFLPLIEAVKNKNMLFISFILFFAVSCFTESMLETNKGIALCAFFYSLFTFHSKEQQLS